MKRKLIILVIFYLIGLAVNANSSIFGKWKTVDDTTGEIKSIVEITEIDGKAYGKIIKLFNEDPNYNPDCIACKKHLKGEKIIGMQIINGLQLKNNIWTGRRAILDPDNGKFYSCKMWIDPNNPNKLIVRGYIGFFYRSQIWLREK